MSLTPQRIAVAACCGLIATGALYATRQRPAVEAMRVIEPRPAVAAPVQAKVPAIADVPASDVPRNVRRVVVTHDRPGQIVFSWEGPDLKVEIIDASPSPEQQGASSS